MFARCLLIFRVTFSSGDSYGLLHYVPFLLFALLAISFRSAGFHRRGSHEVPQGTSPPYLDEAVNASFIHDRACDSEHDIVARGTTLLPIAHGSSPVVSLEAHPILEEEFPGRFVDAGKHATHHNARCSHRQSLDSRPCACDAAVCDHRNAIGPC